MEYKKGSDTEVTCDFVFEPPQATIGPQRSVLPGVGSHWCTVPFVFYESNLTYVTVPTYLLISVYLSLLLFQLCTLEYLLK